MAVRDWRSVELFGACRIARIYSRYEVTTEQVICGMRGYRLTVEERSDGRFLCTVNFVGFGAIAKGRTEAEVVGWVVTEMTRLLREKAVWTEDDVSWGVAYSL
jgi:hypothetical protein